jgi:hypothetical protein
VSRGRASAVLRDLASSAPATRASRVRLAALATLLGVAFSCVDLRIEPVPAGGNHPIANPSFSTHLQPILTQTCATSGACHLGPGSQLGLDLSTGQSYDNLVNVQASERPSLLRVEPGDPDSSFLILKLEGAPGAGVRMPSGAPPLAAEVIQSFRNWITNGAPNN